MPRHAFTAPATWPTASCKAKLCRRYTCSVWVPTGHPRRFGVLLTDRTIVVLVLAARTTTTRGTCLVAMQIQPTRICWPLLHVRQGRSWDRRTSPLTRSRGRFSQSEWLSHSRGWECVCSCMLCGGCGPLLLEEQRSSTRSQGPDSDR